MLTPAQVKNATQSNPAYAQSLGWDKRLGEVTAFLGVAGAAANDPRLAQNVKRFQGGHPPLQKDGVIGRSTWEVLKNAIENDITPSGDPNAPPLKTSKPTPARVRALDAWLLSLTAGHAQSEKPWTFYEKVDAYLGPFGDKGYPIAYGKKYCVLFSSDALLAHNPTTRAWVWHTTILLQTYLRLYIVKRYEQGTLGTMTEAELREAAFDSHPLAYTRGGLTLVLLIAPHLLAVITAIPAVEFISANSSSSWAQAYETAKLVLPEAAGMSLAGLAGPAHTGLFTRAATQDRVAFQRRMQLGGMLDQLKQAILGGKLDRIVWLERATTQLNQTEYPDQAMSKFAGEVVAVANARKKQLAARYREEIRLVPDLRRQYDAYDPDWIRW
jgi:hypothetical protein